MTKFVQIRLNDMLRGLGEDDTKSILSSFVCDKNKDVEDFIRNKAIEFSKRGFAKTKLVYWVSDDEKEKELVGYFTIASRYICVSKDSVSKTLGKRLFAHGRYNEGAREYIVSAPLIGQLGKNYANGNDCLISGSDLLAMALKKIVSIQEEIGGKFVYLECENKPKLIHFYESNGFTVFGKRKKDRDEIGVDGEYLIQLLKYLN